MKHLPTNNWYYYQNEYRCEQMNDELNQYLNRIIESKIKKEVRTKKRNFAMPENPAKKYPATKIKTIIHK